MAINKVGSKGIVDCSVAAADFAPGTVTSVKLADDAVTNAKLSNSSLTASGTSVALGASITLNNAFIDWQSKVTSDGSTVTTMVAGRGYFVDNSSAAGIVKLPASASIGDKIVIKDYAGNFATNKLTIQRNGHNIQGVANDSLIGTNRASVVLVYVDATKGWLYTDEHNVADLQKNQFTSATGGTVATSGDFKIHSFTGDGNFVVSQVGTGTGPNTVDYLVVAGGGAGGYDQGSGAGAGGYREAKTGDNGTHNASPLATPTGITLTATTYPITVGGGGSAPGNGSNSVFSTITSAGGGGGKGAGGNGNSGGSGSGGGGQSTGTGGSGNTPPVSPPQGQNGGNGAIIPGCSQASGGGGGAGGAGGNSGGTSNAKSGGAGGNGTPSEISGSAVTRAGGGGGAAGGPGTSGGGAGPGGGAAGTINSAAGNNGTANTGGGAGGAGNPPTATAGSGGKGIVIIRYKFQ
jgi:hypothetical protein